MEGLTLTRRPALARVRSLDAETVARVAFGLLCVAFAVGFFVYPTYPNYDSYYSLLWGREVLDLETPGFVDGGELPGLASTVVDLTRLDSDREWSVLREGAMQGAEVAEALSSAAGRPGRGGG